MNDPLVQVLSNLSSVTPDSHAVMEPYYTAFLRTRRTVRFYMSGLVLSNFPKVYLYGVYRDCLLVLKRRKIHTTSSVYLLLPPMHLHGDTKVELEVLKEFQNLGIGSRLSSEDLDLYGKDMVGLEQDDRNTEFLYRAGDMVELVGSKFKRLRYEVNKAKVLQASGGVEMESVFTLTPNQSRGCLSIIKMWKEQKHPVQGMEHFIKDFNAHSGRASCSLLKEGQRLSVFSITDTVVPGHGVITTRLRDYSGDWNVGDPMSVVHYLDCAHVAGIPGPDSLLNMGADGGMPGLRQAKLLLRPVTQLPVYKQKPVQKVSPEVWEMTAQVQVPENNKSVLDLFG